MAAGAVSVYAFRVPIPAVSATMPPQMSSSSVARTTPHVKPLDLAKFCALRVGAVSSDKMISARAVVP